jgi:hypothetical protein
VLRLNYRGGRRIRWFIVANLRAGFARFAECKLRSLPLSIVIPRGTHLKPGAARNNAYLVVELPVLSGVLLPLLFVSFDFDFDFESDLLEFDRPCEFDCPELESGVLGDVDVPGELVPGVEELPGVVELPGLVEVPGCVEPGVVPPACANSSEPPRKAPTAGVSNNATFLRIMVSL